MMLALLLSTLLLLSVPGSCAGEEAPPERWTWWSNDQLGEFVHKMQESNPEHCKAFNIGKSFRGNDIWTLTVSTRPDAFPSANTPPSSLAPSFLYVGGVHGNEPLGRQLMFYMAEELCAAAGRQGVDPEIDRILAGGTVHLLFSMNPDGFEMNRRGNGHDVAEGKGVDLNRNFPDPIKWSKFPQLTGNEEPETLALMNYIDLLGDSLIGATHLHGGAEVMVIPFDGNEGRMKSPNPTPDDKLFRYLGRRYVDANPEMESHVGRYGGSFDRGMVQGSNWYPLWGGLQDFFYLKNQVYFTTIEMSDEKWPDASELPKWWKQHRPSMYELLKAYLCQGLTVQVDFPEGSSEHEVNVTMLNKGMGSQVRFKTSSTHGVHYPVPAGEYSVRVEWKGGAQVFGQKAVSGEVSPDQRTLLRVEVPVAREAAEPDKPDLSRKESLPERWTWWSNDQLGEFVHKMQESNPEHCKAFNIGKSFRGNDIWTLTVSTRPDAFPSANTPPSSLAPSFLYVGGVHGNEPLGRQLMFYMAEELCAAAGRQGVDPEIDRILAGGTVHLLFSMNPDGFEMKQRGNGKGVDLNRNFPDPIKWSKFPQLTGNEEPETLALMNYIDLLGDSLIGATHLHGGAEVMVIPFDGNKSGKRAPNPTPDDKLIRYLGRRYVDAQPEMATNNGRGVDAGLFQNGMVQGSNWYPLWGGLQDFFYLKNQVYFTTIEMSDEKWPDASELPKWWKQHRPSMYELLKAYLCQGLTVQVDFPDGAKEEQVVVTMLNKGMGSQVRFKTSSTHGVHYPVPAGEYSVRVEWKGGWIPKKAVLSTEVRPDERTLLRAQKPGESNVNIAVVPAAPRQEEPAKKESAAGGNQPMGTFAFEPDARVPPRPTLFPYVRRASVVVIFLLPVILSRRRWAGRVNGPRTRHALRNTV